MSEESGSAFKTYVKELHQIDDTHARQLAEDALRTSQHSAIIRHHLTMTDAWWATEVGHWLGYAKRHQILKEIITLIERQIVSRPKEAVQDCGPEDDAKINPNDPRYLKLWQILAPLMVLYFLERSSDWELSCWEPKKEGDVDLLMTTNDKLEANIQVKASDQPGHMPKKAGHRPREEGEYDDRVSKGITNAVTQLQPHESSINVVVMCANRYKPLASSPKTILSFLYGDTVQRGDIVRLPNQENLAEETRGKFYCDSWQHISAVVFLDLVPHDPLYYSCTALPNPRGRHPARREWFPRARFMDLSEGTVQWKGGMPPSGDHSFPPGTVLD